MIIAVSGLTYDKQGNKGSAGAGKSTVTDRLVTHHGFVEVAFADVLKRFLSEVFDFSDQQLWGPSEYRNAPDKRYVTGHFRPDASEQIQLLEDGRALASIANSDLSEEQLKVAAEAYYEEATRVHLTPRHALQTLGTEWGRQMCWYDIWVDYGMRVAKEILTGIPSYSPQTGLRYPTERERQDRDYAPWGISVRGVVFSDMRFGNELTHIRSHGGFLVRVKRPVEQLSISSSHLSENALNQVPDEDFDHVLEGLPNDAEDLRRQTDTMIARLQATQPKGGSEMTQGVG